MVFKGIQSVVWKEGARYVSQCLNVDVASFGPTKQAALDNLREALELYFDDLPKKVRTPRITSAELVAM